MASPNILLVHPDEGARTTLAWSLSAAGCTVLTAADFAEARRLLATREPAVVVATLRLGAYNAIHLAHVSRASRPDVRVVIIGYGDPVLEREAAAAGAVYLIDPSYDAVADTVVALLRTIQRRWPRFPVDVEAWVASQPVRLVEVSYGGFRFEAPADGLSELGAPFALTIGGVTVNATPVWKKVQGGMGESSWYGAAVSAAPDEAQRWHALVDARLEGAAG